MTPRQRILDAIDHKAIDALPIGFKATVDVFDRFKRQFGVDNHIGVLDALPVDTHGVFNNGQEFHRRDNWTARATAHLKLARPWTGTTTFILKALDCA